MKHEEITELLGAYALDAVDPDERSIVDDHLAGCARCRAEVAEHREVASLLAHGGGEAPDGVWQRIAGSLEAAPPRLQLAPVDPTGPRRRSQPRGVIMSMAAAAAVAIVAILGVQVRDQDARIDELQLALADPLGHTFQAALADPDARLIELTSADGETVLRGAVTEDGMGYVSASALPTLDAGRTYQLWGGAGDELVSLGVLGSDPTIVSFAAAPYELFAITEEAAPGVVVSENPPVVAGRAV